MKLKIKWLKHTFDTSNCFQKQNNRKMINAPLMHSVWRGKLPKHRSNCITTIVYSWRMIRNAMSESSLWLTPETKMNYLADKKVRSVVYYKKNKTELNAFKVPTLFSEELWYLSTNPPHLRKNDTDSFLFRDKRKSFFSAYIHSHKLAPSLFIPRPNSAKVENHWLSMLVYGICSAEPKWCRTAWHLHFEVARIRIWNGKLLQKSDKSFDTVDNCFFSTTFNPATKIEIRTLNSVNENLFHFILMHLRLYISVWKTTYFLGHTALLFNWHKIESGLMIHTGWCWSLCCRRAAFFISWITTINYT